MFRLFRFNRGVVVGLMTMKLGVVDSDYCVVIGVGDGANCLFVGCTMFYKVGVWLRACWCGYLPTRDEL
jgi:hypothetical protein